MAGDGDGLLAGTSCTDVARRQPGCRFVAGPGRPPDDSVPPAGATLPPRSNGDPRLPRPALPGGDRTGAENLARTMRSPVCPPESALRGGGGFNGLRPREARIRGWGLLAGYCLRGLWGWGN